MKERLNRLRATFNGLSGRERLLLSAAAGLLGAIVVLGGIVNPVVQAGSRARERSAAAEQQVELMLRMRREYDAIASRLSSVEQRIRSSADRRKIRTLLDALASESSVKIDKMEERQTPESDLYKETKVEVSLTNVTLTQAVNYLHKIETAGRLLSIKSLRIKNRRGRSEGANTLDMSFAVSSFEPR